MQSFKKFLKRVLI